MTVGTLADLAAIDGMPSEPTLRRLIAARSDFPVIRAGRSGARYQLDLDAAAAFVRNTWRDVRKRSVECDEQLAAEHDRRLAARAEAAARPGGTLGELAAIEGMPSLPSLQRFIVSRADFPVMERGCYGRPYRLDLDEAAQFVRKHWRDGRRRSVEDERRIRAEQMRQPSLPGLLDTAADERPC